MAQPDTRKYQLFPKEHQSTAPPEKVLAPDEAYARAMGQSGQTAEKADKVTAGGLRFRINNKEYSHAVPARRRKVSVPELGPMTTVHESSMDSPTIPGRPVLHERSASAPGSSWRHIMTYKSSTAAAPRSESNLSPIIGPPVSPKDLPPLMIPSRQMSSPSPLKKQLSLSRLRAGKEKENQDTTTTRSTRPEDSPKPRTPYTPPVSATTQSTSTTPWSATYSCLTTSTLPTPLSAAYEDGRDSTRLFRPDCPTPTPDTAEMSALFSAVESSFSLSSWGHRRNFSESCSSVAASTMNRARPKKSIEGTKRTESRTQKSAERLAFEHLPKGWKVPDAVKALDASETTALHKQALRQAERFEIMRKSDVDSLSRELRKLDERCEYLRRTYHSLRAGRRNLHARICSYLRSPRTVKFSQDSLLKQEEALAELDNSIDDWISKLEQAENRRTRVRQKLLEHVAAATTLFVCGATNEPSFTLDMRSPHAPRCPSTPPRSPTLKPTSNPQIGSVSPMSHKVVAQVPPTIVELPVIEEIADVSLGTASASAAAAAAENEPATIAGIRRAEVESIRIYAGDEVAALLADVEQEITRMKLAGERHAVAAAAAVPAATPILSDEEHRELHRARSAEALQAGLKAKASSGSLRTLDGGPLSAAKSPLSNSTPRATTPTVIEEKEEDLSNFMLSPAVFNPHATAMH